MLQLDSSLLLSGAGGGKSCNNEAEMSTPRRVESYPWKWMVVHPLVVPYFPTCALSLHKLSNVLMLAPGHPLQYRLSLKDHQLLGVKARCTETEGGSQGLESCSIALVGKNICCFTNPVPTNAYIYSRGLCI